MRCSRTAALLVFVSMLAHESGAQKLSVIYNFGIGGPMTPRGSLAQGTDGNLYGTTDSGGLGVGTIFRLTPSGVLTTVHSFGISDGQKPSGGLTLGTDGNLYGATSAGGKYGFGNVYRITPGGRFSVIHDFSNGTDGAWPQAPPILGSDGNFYGITTSGGVQGYGTVYRISRSGSLKTIYAFSFSDGFGSYSALTQGMDGNFYGVTPQGGSQNFGTVFKVTAAGSFNVLHNFDDFNGGWPYSSLVQGSDGNLYGSTSQGGTDLLAGLLFKITPSGTFAVIHDFTGSDGSAPVGGMIQATDRKLYGVTGLGGNMNYGTVFAATNKQFSVLYYFDSLTGSSPYVTPLQHTNGLLYGSAEGGGTGGAGTVYSIDVGALPFVSLVLNAGKVGSQIGVLGQGFATATGVSFNGVPATFAVVSDAYLTAIVPAGASSGTVTVTTSTGTLKSNTNFRVH